MAITYIGNGEYRAATAADVKPTTGIYAGARLIELDTKQEFYWTGSNWTNRLITVQADISGATEIVGSWTLGNSVGGSKIEFANASSTDTIFSPWIRAYNLDDATHPGMYVYAYVDSTHDTGTQSVMRFDVRKADNSALTTRPLYSFRNAGAEVFAIGQTSFGFANKDLFNIKAITTTGAITVNKAGEAAAGEILQLWTLSDGGSSQIEFRNASGVDGEFAPWIRVYNYIANATHPGLYLYSHILNTQDTGTMPALIFDSRRTDAAAITTRPLFDFRTAGTSVFKINGKGDVLQTVVAQATTFETLYTWQMADDATSSIKIFNNTNTDGHFSPMIISQYDKTLATMRAFTLRGVIPTAQDSGTTPVTIFDSRKADGGLITVRPLFEFHNVNTSVMQIKAGGDVLHLPIAATGVAETIAEFRISDVNSYLRIINGTATDARFLPQITGRQVEDASFSALSLQARIETGHDSGTVPVTIFDSRTQSDTAVATRPLFDFRTAGNSVFKIDPLTVSTVLPLTVTKNAEVGVAEILSTWQVAAAGTSRMEIRNSTATGGEFHPQIRAFNMSANNVGPGLYLDSFIDTAQDSSTTPVVVFRALKADSTAPTVRPLYEFRSGPSAALFRIEQTQIVSTLTHALNRTSQASTAETLQSWKVSDDANSSIEVLNAVATDAQFVPWIRASCHVASTANPGLYLFARILTGQDSGITPVMIFDSRTTGDTAIVNRPLYRFRNAGSTMLEITPSAFDFSTKEIKGEYFMDKIGQYSCTSMYDVDGWGLLSGLQGYGNFVKNLDSSGSGHFWDTGTTIGTAAGVAQLGAVGTFIGWMRSANLPFVKARMIVPSYTAADSRFYFGWYTTATLVPNSDTPMNVNDGGVLIGYRSTDTNYQIFRGPADGSTTPPAPIDTGIAVPASAALNFFEIKVNNATSVDVTIYNSSGTTVLYTTNLTTNLPASTKSLNFNAIMYNTTTTLKRLTIYSIAMRSNI